MPDFEEFLAEQDRVRQAEEDERREALAARARMKDNFVEMLQAQFPGISTKFIVKLMEQKKLQTGSDEAMLDLCMEDILKLNGRYPMAKHKAVDAEDEDDGDVDDAGNPTHNGKQNGNDSDESSSDEGSDLEDLLKQSQESSQERDLYDITIKMKSEYESSSATQIFRDFPNLALKPIREALTKHNYHYVPTYFFLDNLWTGLLDLPDPQRRGVAIKNARKKGKFTVKKDPAFRRERRWLKQKLAKDMAEISKAEREAENLREYTERGELMTCGCCYDEEIPANRVTTCGEGHMFCLECGRRAAENVIGMSRTELKCLASDCTSTFNDAEARRFLSKHVFDRLMRIRQQKELEKAGIESLVECPFCPYAAIVENEDDKEFRCESPKCRAVSCRLCKAITHIPLTCEEYAKQRDEDHVLAAQHKAEEEMSKALIRECTKCKTRFFKEEGCNKMTCPTCMTVTCYLCKKEIRNGYAHFDPTPANSKAANPSLCRLWEDTKARHEREVREAKEKALGQLQQENPYVVDKLRLDVPEPGPAPSKPASTPFTRVTRSATRAAAAAAPAFADAPTIISSGSGNESVTQLLSTFVTEDMQSDHVEQISNTTNIPSVSPTYPTPATSTATSTSTTTTTPPSTETTAKAKKRKAQQHQQASVGKDNCAETKPSRKRTKNRKDSAIALGEDATKALEIHQEQQPTPTLLNLPPELFALILTFLYPSEITKLATLSRETYRLVESQSIWTTIQMQRNLPVPKIKYPTAMVVVLAYSDLVCEQCMSLSEMKRGCLYSNRPLPVSLAWNPHHTIRLCLPCRRAYYKKHPVVDQDTEMHRQLLKGHAQSIYQLSDSQLFSLNYDVRIARRYRNEYYVFEEDEVRQKALEYHGGKVGIEAERHGYVQPRHKKPRRGMPLPGYQMAHVSEPAAPEMTVKDLLKADIRAPGEGSSSSNVGANNNSGSGSGSSQNHSRAIVQIGGDQHAAPVAGLPQEIWREILSRLRIRDLVVLAGVSKPFLTLIEGLPIWQQIWTKSQLPALKPRSTKTYLAMVSRFGESICEVCHQYSYPSRGSPADRPLPVVFRKLYSPTRRLWICLKCRNRVLKPKGGWGREGPSCSMISRYEVKELFSLPRDALWDIDPCGRCPFGEGPLFYEDEVRDLALDYHGGKVGLRCATSDTFPKPRHQRPKPKRAVTTA
ncbi:hypothetical protein DFQ27_003157 [Actinomortierella ambigua]|uniref:RING-type domain-containing protein n=1 Tax=Actinomortierella ambigua TaxID=1343610 RepID=A0A9P6U5X9_9FUNG|nr:hypothetical protein DFQ27_003157 [Actinomortierella ambigua]